MNYGQLCEVGKNETKVDIEIARSIVFVQESFCLPASFYQGLSISSGQVAENRSSVENVLNSVLDRTALSFESLYFCLFYLNE